MRQHDDALFAQALNNMAIGCMTGADIDILKGISLPSLPANVANDRDDRVVRLYSTNDAVNNCNTENLSGIDSECFESICYDQVVGKGGNAAARLSLSTHMMNADIPAHETIGLNSSLTLKIGARHMITSNIETSDGLINGTTGILKKIEYGQYKPSPGSSPVKKAIRVWLLLDDIRSGSRKRAALPNNTTSHSGISASWTPIEPVALVVKKRMNSPVSVKRTQFPMTVAEAVTIHKSQGSTYSRVL